MIDINPPMLIINLTVSSLNKWIKRQIVRVGQKTRLNHILFTRNPLQIYKDTYRLKVDRENYIYANANQKK